jgi:hypothetical protein
MNRTELELIWARHWQSVNEKSSTFSNIDFAVDMQSTPKVTISTVAAALIEAAHEMGYTLSDNLVSLMIGQLRGAEGAYPGVKSSLGGTNNMGAAQVTASLASLKKGLTGWGAYAHRDSDPNKGAYIGWYWIAPTPLEAARHWLQDNWWGKALANGNPQSATDYATILYRGRYFGGMHAGDPGHDPMSDAGKKNIADYAAAVNRGRASASELAQPSSDINAITVDPLQFASLDARKITRELFDKALSGGMGSSWKYLLSTWDDFVKNNGVVWFGPPPSVLAAIKAPYKLGLKIEEKAKEHPLETAALAIGIIATIALFLRKKK